MSIPKHFCWSKFGVEAGEAIQSIIARKEVERIGNEGIFLWGIGNALGPSIAALLHNARMPEVLFTPIRSAPRAVDVSPTAIVAWTSAETIDGSSYDLPPASFVTSRAPSRAGKSHYALVCRAERTLTIEESEDRFFGSQMKNLKSGNLVGFSQVTSVVCRDEKLPATGAQYMVAMRAQLVFPYFVRLCDPVEVPVAADVSDPRFQRAVRSQNAAHHRVQRQKSRQLVFNVH